MNSNYYTPEIEEFCVGFEYEVLEKTSQYDPNFSYLMPPLEKDKWFKFKFPDPYVGWNAPKILQKEVRVKYLDREDIESLGFTFYGQQEVNKLNQPVMMLHSDELNLMIGYYYEINKVVIATKDPSKNEIFKKTGQDPNRIAGLKIKNKTELERLLKRIDG